MSDNATVSQVVMETLYTSTASARVSQTVVEILHISNSNAIVSQLAFEVLRSADPTFTSEVSVENTLTVGQTIKLGLSKTISVISTADIGQTINAPNIFDVTVENTLTVSHIIGNFQQVTILVTSTGIVDQTVFVNSPRVLTVTNQSFISQTITGINATTYVSISHSINAGSFIYARPGLFRVNVVSTANIDSKFARRDIITSISVNTNITVNQRITSEYRLDVTSTADASQLFVHLRTTVQAFAHVQVLTDEFAPTRLSVHLLTDNLILVDTYERFGQYERDFGHIQMLTDTYRQVIVVSDSGYQYDPYPVGPGQPPRIIPPHPVAGGTPVVSAQQTIIDSPGGTIILPAAELGDSFGAKIQTTVKKTMTGKIYTYIKTSTSDKFTLTWILGLDKALELALVIQNNIDYFIGPYNGYIITMWNGQIWDAKIISTDIPLTHEGRWQNSDNNDSENEKMTITINFEGTRLL